jgi:hypothetical protein
VAVEDAQLAAAVVVERAMYTDVVLGRVELDAQLGGRDLLAAPGPPVASSGNSESSESPASAGGLLASAHGPRIVRLAREADRAVPPPSPTAAPGRAR